MKSVINLLINFGGMHYFFLYLCTSVFEEIKKDIKMNIVWISTVVLAAIGVIAALLLYFVSQKFKVEEDPMIDEV